jgi:proline racemase
LIGLHRLYMALITNTNSAIRARSRRDKSAMLPSLTLPAHTRRLPVTDMHTCGEPVRIIELPDGMLTGTTLERRQQMKHEHDDIRSALMLEPRGHNDMYGAILSSADKGDPDQSPHVLFCHTTGYSTMCGHATLALGRYLHARGIKPADNQAYLLRVPCGSVSVTHDSATGMSEFESVTCLAHALNVEIEVDGIGKMRADIGYGGAFYLIVPDQRVGLDINACPITEAHEMSRRLFRAARQQHPIVSSLDEDLNFLYGVILTDGADNPAPTRNICLFGEDQIDRSPTGSGVGARLAVDFARGQIGAREWREFRGTSDLAFEGQIRASAGAGIKAGIRGSAYFTGQGEFFIEPTDPLRAGFQLD